MREVCKGPGTKKDAALIFVPSNMRALRRSLARLHRASAFLPQQSLLAGYFKTIGCGGRGGRGDAPTVPSIKVSSAFVFLLRIIALYLQIHEFLG